MRVKGTTVQQIILGVALLAALCWNLAQANEIKGLQLSEAAAGTRAEPVSYTHLVAAFGKKDFQQLAVIQQMVTDLAYPLTLLRGDIVREADGLAMSSRNQYLSADDRVIAAEIHRTLLDMRAQLLAGVSRTSVEAGAALRLEESGFSVDYAAIRTPDLAEPDIQPAGYAVPGPRVALIAARLGRTRLIDNLEFALG